MKHFNKFISQAFSFANFEAKDFLPHPSLEDLRVAHPTLAIKAKVPHTIISGSEVKPLADRAEVIFICDVSGSIDSLCRKQYAAIIDLVNASLEPKYEEEVVVRVIGHHTRVNNNIYDVDSLLNNQETGGTIVSSGYVKAEEYINSDNVDYYIVQLTDGDNWADDSPQAIAKLESTITNNNVRGAKYFEITNRNEQSLGRAMKKNPYVDSYFMDTCSLEIKSK